MFKHTTIYRCVRNTLNNTGSGTGSSLLNSSIGTKSERELATFILREKSNSWRNSIALSTHLIIHPTCHRTMSSSSSSDKAKAATSSNKHTNRLAQSKSPYLLQHAHNPVDWYPWCEEAFERARIENKMIFLSVGYSTCHWCHVMEHESFEDEDVAAVMNEHYVNIKVDREERPDIDKIYMQFLLMTKRSGGWPMSVWLTPDLAPIMAGTYYPPVNRYGMPSFKTVLLHVAKKWSTESGTLKQTGTALIEAMQQSINEDEPVASSSTDTNSVEFQMMQSLSVYKQRFDQDHGGFGTQPKFPEVSRLNFLFHAYIKTKDTDVLDMVLETLDHIGRGGINDHVFGGFARYAVDQNWHVPHFEKMLYDQGQLLSAYSNGYKLTHKMKFLNYADSIFRYIMKDLRHPAGGFYSGEDADSLPSHTDTVKVEGAFYAWTWDEVKAAIDANEARYNEVGTSRAFDIYTFHYGMLPTGNVAVSSDPHGHLTGKNIFIVRGSDEDTCANFNITEEELSSVLKVTNDILHQIREKRPRPHLDTKIICSWNGLVLSGLSKLANCGSDKREEYLQAAKSLVVFARTKFFDSERKILVRSCYGKSVDDEELEKNEESIDGFLDDYAFLISGLLDYYKASLDCSVLALAKELQDIQDKLFLDEANGAYYFSQANSSNVILRMKEDHDGAEPSGNSVSARNLILLSHYYDDDSYLQRAKNLFKFFSNVKLLGQALPEMMSALFSYDQGLDLVAVVGPESPDKNRFVEICRKFYIPGMIILHVDPHNPDNTCNQTVQKKFKMVNGKTTVYICHDRVCQMPFTDPEKLEQNLTENFFCDQL